MTVRLVRLCSRVHFPVDFRSRIFANSRGSTIDAVGNGQYLVCHHSSCFKVKGWRRAHEAVKRLEGSSD
jgi:hypothetical protein